MSNISSSVVIEEDIVVKREKREREINAEHSSHRQQMKTYDTYLRHMDIVVHLVRVRDTGADERFRRSHNDKDGHVVH